MNDLLGFVTIDHDMGLTVGEADVFEGAKSEGDFYTFQVAVGEGDAQDSDLMERIPARRVKADPLAENVQLVSLGCSCAPKLSFEDRLYAWVHCV